MKYFVALFLTISACFGSNQLVASEIAQYLTYFWSGNEEDLYLNIDLVNELEFSNNYSVMKTKNGQGCEVVCKPIFDSAILSSEGYELQEIKFTVMLNNIDNPNKVSSTIITETSYKGVNDKGLLLSTISESKKESVINNPAIDLTQEPDFFIISDNPNEGVISFKNSFPYSQIQ